MFCRPCGIALAVALVATAHPTFAAPAPLEHGAVSLGPFLGYLQQVDIHLTLFPVEPLVIDLMLFRAWGSFWPALDSWPRDGGGLSVGVRSRAFTVWRLMGYVTGLVGYREVLLRAAFLGDEFQSWYHGLVTEGVLELLVRIEPALAVGLRFASGFLFFPGQDAPYFTYSARASAGGLAPEWQLGFEVAY